MALRVIRPEFRAMLRDLASGAVGALICYDLDRIARDPRDLEDLIDVLESTGSPARNVTGSLDLSTDAGITMARVLTAMANKASRDTSRRVSRALAEQAERGGLKGGGVRWFGYDRDGVIIPEEAATVRRIATDILAGRTTYEIAADLNSHGAATVTGVPWSKNAVGTIIKKPMVAGLRVYKGEIVGKANCEPILTQDVWERVLLALKSRSGGATNKMKHWLNQVLVCGLCGAGVVGSSRGSNRSPAYLCITERGGCGKLAIAATPTEETISAWIIGYLERTDISEELRAGATDDAAAAARTEATADQAQLKELAGMWGRKQLTTAEYLEARKEIEARLAKWEGVVRASLPEAMRNLSGASHIAPAEAFLSMSAANKYAVAGFVFPKGITVAPFAGGRRRFDASRLSAVAS